MVVHTCLDAQGYEASVSVIRIDNEDDTRLSEFRNVPDAELLTRLGLFVAEGRLVVARLITSGLSTRSVLVTETAFSSLEGVLTGLPVPVYVVPRSVMNTVAGFNFHRGCLALGVRPPARDWRDIVAASRERARLVVLERVSNVDNVGSIFRNAAAFGADGVLLQADCADPLYRKAIRTSMAASLTMPYARAPWPDTLRELAASGSKVFLDMKLLDIDNTVAAGVANVARMGVSMLTIHAYPKAMLAAVEAARGSDLCLLGVTVLTSMDAADLAEAGYHDDPAALAARTRSCRLCTYGFSFGQTCCTISRPGSRP